MNRAEKAIQYFIIAVPENKEQAEAYFWARKALNSIILNQMNLSEEKQRRIYAEEHATEFLLDCMKLNKKLEAAEARVEKAERERDAAVSDLEYIMAYGNSDACQLCKNGQCHIRGGTKPCLPKWRGQKEE